MSLKLGSNFGTITGNNGSTLLYWGFDNNRTGTNKICLHVQRRGAGTTADPYTYMMVAINKTQLQSYIGNNSAVILDPKISVDSFLDGLLDTYVTAGTYDVPLSSIDNLPDTLVNLRDKSTATQIRTVSGTGIDLNTLLGLSTTTTLTIGNGTGTGTKTGTETSTDPTLTDAEKATLAEIAKEKTRKAGTLGFVSSWKGTTTTGFAYKFGSWVQDNPLLFLLVGLISWNFVIQPNFFPKVTFLTFGDTKEKALELIEAGKKKTGGVRRRINRVVQKVKGKKRK